MDSFKDNKGREWTPLVSAAALVEADQHARLTVRQLMLGEFSLGQILELLWCTCSKRAKALEVSRDDFFESLTLKEATNGIQCLLARVGEAFPEVSEEELAQASPLLRTLFQGRSMEGGTKNTGTPSTSET